MTTVTATPAQAVQPAPGKPAYKRATALGLFLVGLAPLIMLILGLSVGMDVGDELGFLLTVAVVPLVAAALVWRFGTWSTIVGLVTGVLAGLALFWTVFGLAYPASFGDFVPGLLVLVGVLLAVGGSVAALVRTRRPRPTSSARGERRLILAALSIIVVAALISGVLNVVGVRGSAAAGADASAQPVTMKDFAFAEGSYGIPAGEPASLSIRNTDAFAHDFTIPDLGVGVQVLPGRDALVELTAEPGTYTIYCTLHSDTTDANPDPEEAMVATLVAR